MHTVSQSVLLQQSSAESIVSESIVPAKRQARRLTALLRPRKSETVNHQNEDVRKVKTRSRLRHSGDSTPSTLFRHEMGKHGVGEGGGYVFEEDGKLKLVCGDNVFRLLAPDHRPSDLAFMRQLVEKRTLDKPLSNTYPAANEAASDDEEEVFVFMDD